MLQRTPHTLVYLSAAELGITERERAALLKVRTALEDGTLQHVRLAYDHGEKNAFNMSCSNTCGSIACIGGWMAFVGDLGSDYMDSMYNRGSLENLFYPFGYSDPKQVWDAITPAQAVRACDHFLAGAGAECWAMALQDIPAA